MNSAEVASSIQLRTKTKTEEKSSSPSPFSFDFDLNETKASAIADLKKANSSEALDDPNATTAIPAVQNLDNSKSKSDNVFEAPAQVSVSAVTSQTGVDELDRNKTVPLSSSFTFKLDDPGVETSGQQIPEVAKEKAPEASFSFTPSSAPPVLEKPEASSENDLMTKKVPVTPVSLAKPLAGSVVEEKKADLKIPPPPGLRANISEAKDNKVTPPAKQDIVSYPPIKTEAPKVELPKPPKAEPPKPPKAEPPKPAKREEKKEEIKTEDLPIPVYNPDIFSPPPIEEPASPRSGLFRGIAVGLSVGALLLVTYFAFFYNPAEPVSSPIPTEEIVKNTPTVVETPDIVDTPTPKPTSTDKPVVATGSVPDSVSGSGKFTIQVRATQSQTEAETLGKKLRGSGAEAYVVKADLGAKGIWYRVRVGRYQSMAEAQKAGSDLRSKGSVSDFIATTY
jgi:hypothetical protein